MVTEQEWAGLVSGHRRDEAELFVQTVLNPRAEQGGSKPAQVLASDNRRYWIKPLSNPQGDRVPVTEQVVARCGKLIGAPTCEVCLLRIPPELDGYQLGENRSLQVGISHGSLDVQSSLMKRELLHRDEDDNRERHAYLYALYDWCWGSDDQWLYDAQNGNKLYSHDHGHFFPGGPRWTPEQLRQHVDGQHQLAVSSDGVSDDALAQAAHRLERLTTEQIAAVLRDVPQSWPVSDEELETLGYFIDRRRGEVARRIRQMISAN